MSPNVIEFWINVFEWFIVFIIPRQEDQWDGLHDPTPVQFKMINPFHLHTHLNLCANLLVDSNNFLWWQVGKLLASDWEVLFFLGLQTYPHALGETAHTIQWAGGAVIQDWDVQGGKVPKTPTAQSLLLNYVFNLTTPAPCIFLLCKQRWGYNIWISSSFLLPFDKASVLVFILNRWKPKKTELE